MDTPPIRYARTDAGEGIAYWTAGSGPVLLHLDPPGLEIGADWERDDFAVWCSALASRFKLILAQLPRRSIGVTAPDERERTVALLDAVLEAEKARVCAVFGVAHSTPTALLYAAARPAVVSHLALWNPYANGATYAATSIRYLLGGIEAIDVEIWSRMVAVAGGASSWEELERMAEEARGAKHLLGNVDSALEIAASTDVLGLLPAISSPVLAFHSKEAHFVGLAATQEVAELLSDCQFLMVAGAGSQPWTRRASPASCPGSRTGAPRGRRPCSPTGCPPGASRTTGSSPGCCAPRGAGGWLRSPETSAGGTRASAPGNSRSSTWCSCSGRTGGSCATG